MRLYSIILFFILTFTLYAEDVDKDIVNTDTVDQININHFFDERGRIVFDQIIFEDFNPDLERYLVRDWRLLKDSRKVYHDAAEKRNIEDKKREEWFKENNIKSTFLKDWYKDICVWNPEFLIHPRYNIDYNNKVVIFLDGDFIRKVHFKNVIETFTQYDPELVNRDVLPKDERSKLYTKGSLKQVFVPRIEVDLGDFNAE